ncbi:hypothetical protein ON010_g12195 [Phytophthora cinnamomi]|nr:hypothetical protein ON010_g12195 [Phytophthora cinnamomi]
MQFSFYLLVVAAILLVSSAVASASIDADAMVSKTTTSGLHDEWEDGERGLPSVLSEKATSTAAKLTRSKSLQAEKAAVQKLTRSKSLSSVKGNIDLMSLQKSALNRDYATMDKMKKTPDDVIEFFNLDRGVLATGDKHQLRAAAKGDMSKLGEYELWYRYTKYYKLKYPEWASKIL